MPEFLGLPCVELKHEALSLLVTTTVGPRILSLRIHGGENLFAEVPEFTLDCPGAGKCHLWGGHRLWIAPERPELTYLPDDRPVMIEGDSPCWKVTQPIDERTGLQKSIEISFFPSQESPWGNEGLNVYHRLRNRGSAPVTCAPWAITQLKTGGFAILPHSDKGCEAGGSWKKRGFEVWPYTEPSCPHIVRQDDFTFVHARLKSGALKLGYANYRNWLGYFRNGTLFTKKALFDPGAKYYDNGSSSECYCNEHFVELETLGPIETIAPGDFAAHHELWNVRDDIRLEPTEASVTPHHLDDLM